MFRSIAIAGLLLLVSVARAQGLPPAGVRTAEVRAETIRDEVTGVATVEPWVRTLLSVEAAGLVESYPLREGQPVTARTTVVCKLKETSLLIDLAEAQALLARAEAQAETQVGTARAVVEEKKALRDRTGSDLARATDLLEKKVIDQAEYDRVESEALAARFQFERARKDLELAESGADPASKAREAEVRRARARLDRVEDQIAKATLRSPIDGVVVRRLTEVGEWVTPGTPVIEILTLDPVLVRVAVNERDIAKLGVGDPATVDVAAHPGRSFAGTVRFIVPEADQTTRAFPVLIEVANPDLLLGAGMFARVRVSAGEGRPALTVSKDAVVSGPRGSTVFTPIPAGKDPKTGRDTFKARAISVTVGRAVDDRVVISGEGIEKGLTVITTGNEKLMPGQTVIPMGPDVAPGAEPEREPR